MASIIDSCDDDFSHLCLYEEEVPQELWIEIFVRASVESLLRVKCVCRRWYALVSNPSFTKKHLQFQKAMSKNKGRFLLQHYEEAKEITNYSLFDEASVAGAALSSFSHNDLLHYSFPNTGMGRDVSIKGPVNGLYCVYGGTDRIVIWNPATKEVSFVPLAGECLPGESSSYEADYGFRGGGHITLGELGFGTDSINEEDYKVVMICEYDNECDMEEFYRLLYTASTNTWRILEDDNFVEFSYMDDFHSNNTFLDGFYYWFHSDGEVVVAFDMGKEIFQKISTPDFHSECIGDLVVHNNNITLLVVNKDLSEIDVWELMVEESFWIKKKTVVIEIRGVHASLGFWKKENEMLLLIDSDDQQPPLIHQTVLYNTTTREITNLGPRTWGYMFKALDYYESLVSLSGSISHASSLDAISYFLSGDTMENAFQRLEDDVRKALERLEDLKL